MPSPSRPVVVIGGGVVGAATAYALTARGERVLLLEQHERGHHLGSSHGATRIFRQGYADAEYVALTTRALELWDALEQTSGQQLVDRTGAVDHGRPEVVDAIASALSDAGIPHETLTTDAAAARWPGIAFEGHVLAHATAGRIRSADAIEVFLTLAERTGLADLRFDTRVTGVEDHGDSATVTLVSASGDTETARTSSLVAAVGSWAHPLVGDLFRARGARLPAVRVTQEQPAHFPSRLPDAAWPSFVHWAEDDDVYGLLTPGEGVKVGFHGTGPVVDPDRRDLAPVPDEAARLQAYVERYVPGVDASRPTFISCLYDTTPDEDFVMDRRGPVTVATGFSGHGFKFAPLLGELLADLATGGAPHPRFALPDTPTLRDAVGAAMPAGLAELGRLVAVPSVHDPAVQSLDDCDRVAEQVRVAFATLGLEARLVTTTDGSQAVIACHPAPAGAPTVLLYAHHDVQPAGDPEAWTSDPWTLTERDGRLYGRGAADCKGGIVTHLVALRALLDVHGSFPVGLLVVVEGSEEQGTDGLEQYVATHASEFAGVDVAVVMDAGNAAVGEPAVVTSLRGTAFVDVRVRALDGNVHSGMFGGAVPDALATLVALLATLRDDAGDTTVDGLDASGTWDGLPYGPSRFAADAGMLDGAEPIGSGDPASQVWARPALTIVGIDAPGTAGATPAVQATAGAALNLRVPPGVDPRAAGELLVAHLLRRAPAGVEVTARVTGIGAGFRATDGPSAAAFRSALASAYEVPEAGSLGGGGSIPLCATLERAIPGVEIVLAGVSEPAANVHAPDESVDPSEIEHMALAEATFLAALAGH